MAEERSVIRIDDFEGLYNRHSAQSIPKGASPTFLNLELFREGFRSRPGYAEINDVGGSLGAGAITGIFDGWNHILVAHGTVLYTYDPATEAFTSRITGLTSGALPDFISYNGLDIMVNGSGNDAPQKWDGTTGAALGGSPPKGDTIEVFNNRVWIGGLASPNQSEVQFSKLEDPETWEGGFIRVSKRQKGRTVKALKTVPVPGAEGGSRLAVFCDDAIFHFEGFGQNTFNAYLVTEGVGTVSARSVCVAEGITYWVDDGGFYASPDGGQTVNQISWRIQPEIEQIDETNLQYAICGVLRHKRQVWFGVVADSEEAIYVYNYGLSNPLSDPVTGNHRWSKYVLGGGKAVRSLAEVLVSSDYLLYAGDSANGWLYKMDVGTQDNGVDFKWNYWTPQLPPTNWSDPNVLRKLLLTCEIDDDNSSLDVDLYKDMSAVSEGTTTRALAETADRPFIEEFWYNEFVKAIQFELSATQPERFTVHTMEIESKRLRGLN